MKPWWTSKTIWANLLGVAALLLNGPLGAHIPPQDLALAMAVLNLALRAVSSQGVTLTKP